jgi:hypothetical protein
MMSADEGQGFVIRDRRGRSDEGGSASEGQAPSAKPERPSQAAGQSQAASQPRTAPPPDPAHSHEAGAPVSFAAFVFSLGTSALMLMGEQLDPRQGKLPVNLPQAKEMIDILSMLEDKTRGNLTAEEQAVLTDMLYALRMKYVDMTSSPGGSGGRQTTASS